jgi:molecular chaperone HtpG
MPPMQDNVIIGVNILETLTTGMYRDPLIIFREYIQNSCDSIDSAVDSKLIVPDEAHVHIWINGGNVSIEDNGGGIPSAEFKQTLYSIGESQKTAGLHKGFRGIGHWCGFAHCSTLVFTAKAAGESVESVMKCDAEKMRLMMLNHRLKRANYSIDDVLSSTTEFFQNQVSDVGLHYFKVEMFDVVDAKDELCNLQNAKDYLSFTIPVGYATEFRFRTQIHKYANEIGLPIQEYHIYVNGEAVLKKYQPSFTTRGKGDDTITDIKFKEFKDNTDNLIAWMWFGISSFKAQMVPANKMRGIRLRSHNIQIGAEDALQKLFNESNGRGLYYYIGEVFAVSNELLPDSQRDYFEPGELRTQFERRLSDFFNDELKSIYYAGSKVNSAFDKIEKAEQIAEEIASLDSISKEQQEKLNKAQDEAKKAEIELTKLREKTDSKVSVNDAGTVEAVVSEIIKKNEERRASRPSHHMPQKSVSAEKKTKNKTDATPAVVAMPQAAPSDTNDKLVSLNKICDIIRALADSSTADVIIAKIKEELN